MKRIKTFTLILCSFWLLLSPNEVKAEEIIYIDVSGVDGITVDIDNIVIDGAGYCLEHLEKIITIFQEIIGI